MANAQRFVDAIHKQSIVSIKIFAVRIRPILEKPRRRSHCTWIPQKQEQHAGSVLTVL